VGFHDPAQVEVFCYHAAKAYDRQSEWYRQIGHWTDCSAMDTAGIVELVRRDAIDILVDLSGFSPNNVLEVFARRAAPIQVAYPNLPSTTGLGNMDYILTDHWICPHGLEKQYTEETVSIPSGYIVYVPPDDSPALTALPAVGNGCITFGLFQRIPKLNSAVLDVVAAVLRACPAARLLIQNGNATLDDLNSRWRPRLLQEFEARGVERERLRIVGGRPQLESMAIMAEADIALDAFPYSGQTTTCECLWMGVPVVTLSSTRHGGRVATALLQRMGLGHLSATTPDEYVHAAATLAADVHALANLRAGMRERMNRGSLLDSPRLGRELDAAYRWMWRRRCSTPQKEK